MKISIGGMSLISVMISSVIAGIIMSTMASVLSNSLKSQKRIERRSLRKDIISYYAFRLNDSEIKNFTKNNSANSSLKAHVGGGAIKSLTRFPSSVADTPSPIYPNGINGIAIYETNSKVLIPKSGLLLNSFGANCTPSPCTKQNAKWKVLVRWVALDNRGYDFYLSVISINNNNVLKFKTYSRLISQLVPPSPGTNSNIDVIQIIKNNIRIVSSNDNRRRYGHTVSIACRDDEILISGYCTPPVTNIESGSGIKIINKKIVCTSPPEDTSATYGPGPQRITANAVCLGHNI